MKRAIIITKGRVQRVGYRDLAADWAIDLGVVGFIENQPDGTGERLHTAAKSLKELIKTTAMMNRNLGNKIE